ncbi:MAG: TPM domain-containing protein, partial [Candidatus Bipolaricaulia bacterium]
MTSTSRLAGIAILAFVGLALLTGAANGQEDISLPQQMGAINDYAASLGRQTREHLQSQVERLSSEANVDLAVLISLIDPFSDPARYAEAIWRQWDLGSKRSVLLVVVREAETRWAFRVLGSSGISDQLSVLRRGEARAAIDDALADRDVAKAVRVGVDALAAQWAPATDSASSAGETTDADSTTSSSESGAATAQPAEPPWWQSLWAWIAGGVALLLL